MPDDRLDDAIDAVVRAVDQIERATRGSTAAPAHTASIPAPAPAAPTPADLSGPVVATRVSPGKAAYTPVDADARLTKAQRKAKKRERAIQAAAAEPVSTTVEQAFQEAARQPGYGAVPEGAEINELVGQIVARTAELEEHLEAARQLRADVTELVGRLAAVANKPR